MHIPSLFGPMFGLETKLAARRWQVYLGRSLFVGLLLVCLSTVWSYDYEYFDAQQALRFLAMAGHRFHYLMVVCELTLILLVAPASTAGAICLDKSRGSLTHLMTTHLTSAEIVLGKLGARLMPILAILTCALPVSIIATLLGGVDPGQLIADYIVCVGLTIFGCSLTTFVSVWGSKPHEVLGVVYVIWALWLIPWIVLEYASRFAPTTYFVLQFLRPLNPFWILLHLSVTEPQASLSFSLFFLTVMGGLSLMFAVFAVLSLRRASLLAADRKRKPVVESKASIRFRKDVPWWPSPSLDKNPVLWREWHRNRPTRWTRIVWSVYLGITALASCVCILANLEALPWSIDRESSMIVVAGSASLGFLLMSVTAATSLAEERVRGSLDVLLATPLSTGSIIAGKWRGTFRLTPLVLIWPILVGYSQVLHILPDMKIFVFYIILAYGFAWGAFVTSLGLALACWTKRLGRALGLSVGIYVGLTVGLPFLTVASYGHTESGWWGGSAFMGMGFLSSLMESRGASFDSSILTACMIWACIYATTAIVLYHAVRLTFNFAMGRMDESASSPGSPGRDDRSLPIS